SQFTHPTSDHSPPTGVPMTRSIPFALVLAAVLVAGCSKSSKPTAPQAPTSGRVVLVSHPAAAAVFINGASVSRFTPCVLDTAAATYAIRLSLLGYADTTVSASVPASPESVSVTLRALAGTPRTVSSWLVGAPAGMYVEGLALDASRNVYVEAGDYGGGV